MKRVLVVGCGYLGQAVADLLDKQGLTVKGWTRTAETAAAILDKPYQISAVDVGEYDEVAAQPGDFNVVVHCASTRGGDANLYRRTYLAGAHNLIRRFGEATLVFTSSTSVYAQRDGEWVTEDSAAKPCHERGRVLRETEDVVIEHSGIVARLSGLYGPNRSALLAKVLANEAKLARDRFVNQIHRDDAAAAVALLAGTLTRQGEIFNVTDDEPMLLSECYRWLAERLGRPWRSQPGKASNPETGKRGDSNKRVSNAKLRKAEWIPGYPTFREGMSRSVLAGGV
jgi:nucleoside-diphosphate-sugar epimerase